MAAFAAAIPLPTLRPKFPSPLASSRRRQIRAARTESTGVSMGFRAPEFELPEPLTGKVWKSDDFEPYPALLVMFICNHCPFVVHLKKDIVKLTGYYKEKGLATVAISSNSTITHPQDGPEFMAEEAKLLKYPFPYLYDETQDIARAFGAVCTPEFFLFKSGIGFAHFFPRLQVEAFLKDGRRPFELFYHGQFDDSRPNNNIPVTGRFKSCNRVSSQLPAIDIGTKAQYWMQYKVASIKNGPDFIRIKNPRFLQSMCILQTFGNANASQDST